MVHGTISRYRRGCRCEACTRANTDYQRAYTQKQRGGGLVNVDRDALSDLLNEWFPDGLTDDCPARQKAAA